MKCRSARHQRHSHPHVALAGHQLHARSLSRRAMDERSNRPERLGRRQRRSPTRNSGAPTSAAASGWSAGRGRRFASSSSAAARAYDDVAVADEVLDPEALTIGFARRFATYKRGALLLREPDRLRELLEDTKRPIQFVFAGKAHPADNEGKELIKTIVNFARDPADSPRIVFIENYDIERRPLPRAGRRRLAQHAAPAVRSLRHQRHEGRRQRRAQLLDPRRLVGRRLRPRPVGWAIGRGETLHRRRTTRISREPGAVRPSRKADRSAVLSARRGQHSARMDRAHEELHAQARAGLQHQPHGARLHREVLHPRLRRAARCWPRTISSAPSRWRTSKDALRAKWAGIKIVGVHTSGNGHLQGRRDDAGRSAGRSAGRGAQGCCVQLYAGPISAHREDRGSAGPER